jgi:hypothetical protein
MGEAEEDTPEDCPSKHPFIFLRSNSALHWADSAELFHTTYDKEKGCIKDIPLLFYDKGTKHFTLKNTDKHMSTLKCLTPKNMDKERTDKDKSDIVKTDKVRTEKKTHTLKSKVVKEKNVELNEGSDSDTE